MANYDMQERVLHTSQGEITVRYPRLLLEGRMETDDFVRLATRYTTFGVPELKGVIGLLGEALAEAMGQGYSIHLDGLGTFTPALRLRPGFEREDQGETRRNARAIRVGNVSFRPDRDLLRATDSRLTLARQGGRLRRSSTQYTEADRLDIARAFIARRGEMSLLQYQALTGLLKDKASRELRRWERSPHETGIRGQGRGAGKRWVAAAAEEGT